LITRDELLAMGALDVPPSWRKSLAKPRNPAQRELFPDTPEDDAPKAERQPAALSDTDCDGSADNLEEEPKTARSE